jgi:hypothetical protein
MFEFLVKFNAPIGVCIGCMFAIIGLLLRKHVTDRDNFVFADGFQGLTVASLLIVAIMVYYIEDVKAVAVLKEQAGLVILLMLLSALQLTDRFRRSLL